MLTLHMTSSFSHKKSLGQHFLNNDRVPGLMAQAGDVKKGDIILEIGPGTGMLTKTLLDHGGTVLAIEADARAIIVLKERFSAEIQDKRLTLIHGDIRTLDLDSLSQHLKNGGYKVIANIPYYLSGMLFRIFLETDVQPTDMVFLVQKEVAERIVRDKKESLLSLSVKVFGTPYYVKTIKRGNFTPPPKVDSAIIAVHGISKERFTHITEAFFFEVLHAGFASKRKQLLGNLSSLFSREILTHTFSTLDIPIDVRGEDVSIEKWLLLVTKLTLHT